MLTADRAVRHQTLKLVLASLFGGVLAVASAASADPPDVRVKSTRASRAHGHAAASSVDEDLLKLGQAIYSRGLSGEGKAVQARRAGGMLTTGADAACANCHQRSGLGTREGTNSIPAIAGRYLTHPRAESVEDVRIPYVEGLRADRGPYTDKTLARAIREGVDADGKPLNFLMPRYALGDADMAALVAYLRALDKLSVPGVTDTELHFATIVAPDADPVERQGMLDVLEHYFADHNAVPRGMMPPPHANLAATLAFRSYRRWQLHVWELQGPPESWQAQLHQRLLKQPVFAVVSGLAGRDWAPVQSFCEQEGVPCLFPNVEAPPPAVNGDFYSLYFSNGVFLEADLIAKTIVEQTPSPAAPPAPAPSTRPGKVDQIYRAGESGEAAATELADKLRRAGIAVDNHALPPGARGEDTRLAVRDADKAAVVVLWLRPDDLRGLGDPPSSAVVYVSGSLGGLEAAPLPAAWRARARVVFPVDPPEHRGVRLDYPLGWFAFRRIPVVAERVQIDTYVACGVLADAINHLADSFVRDYLIEHVQHVLEKRVVTGYYPRLALSAGQRFASKGGYLVHFVGPSGILVQDEGGWLVP